MSSIDPGVMWLDGGHKKKKRVRRQRRTLIVFALEPSKKGGEVVLVNMRDQGGARHVGQSAEHAMPIKINHKPRRRRR